MSNTLLLQNVKLFLPGHELHDQLVEVYVKDGSIESLGPALGMAASDLIDGEGGYVSAGWLDAFGTCPDPGEPWKETLQSYTDAAQQSGFIQVAVLCGKYPKPDNESLIAQVKQVGSLLKAEILPLGFSSSQGEGQEMAEMYEMSKAGAVAFTDGVNGTTGLSLRTKLMQYAHSLGLVYLNFPFQKSLASDGKMHEGIVNASLGLKGIPAMSETVELLADIELAKYLNASLRTLCVSSAESVELIRKAKADGLEIYAAVPVLNLVFTDEAMTDFDEFLKVSPPLRSEADRRALTLGLLDGTLDAVVSNHCPEDIESKKVEFDYAAWGASTMSYVFPLMCKVFENERPENWVPLLYQGSRKFLGVKPTEIAAGMGAHLTIFTLEGEFAQEKSQSRAYNVPNLEGKLKGRVIGTIRNGCYMKNHV